MGGAEVDEAVAPVELGEVFEGGWRGEVDFVDVGGQRVWGRHGGESLPRTMESWI